jgi:peptide-methionine (R)-S-oxide reductase
MSTPHTGTNPPDAELKAKLTPLQYEVTQHQGTERAFTGAYWDCHDEGTYRCIVCDTPLFTSETKYDSRSGWPSFYRPAADDVIEVRPDTGHGMVRDEIVCAGCGAHVGHVFPDGPEPTGARYCTNSASLRLDRSGGMT